MPSNFPRFSNNGCELGDLLDYRPEMKSWCYRVLPLTYDDSLSYYEVLCKNIAMISKALSKDMPEMMNTINCMQNFIQAMSSHLNEFIDDYNTNVDRIDGELSRIETKFDDAVTRLDAEDERLDNKIDSEAADIRAKYVKKAGDTMTGPLYIKGDDPKQCEIKSTSITFSSAGSINGITDPTNIYQATNKNYVDNKISALGTVLEYKGTKPNIAALPSTGNKAGDVWYVESEQSAYAWVIDTANPQGHWEEFGPPINLEPYLKKDGSVPMTGQLDMGGHTVTNTAAPTNNTDVANKGYVDTKVGDINRFVLKSGDTMTGSLNMSNNKVTNVKDPTDRKDAVNMGFLSDHVLTEEGGTMTTGKISIPFHVECNDTETKSQVDIEGTDSNGTYKTLISDGRIVTKKSHGNIEKTIDISSKCGEQQHIDLIEKENGVETNTTEITAGRIDFHGNEKGHIVNVDEPLDDYDVANKKYVDEHGGGVQPITVTRDSAYISTATNNFTTKVLADPTAPSERPINKDQIAVYSETNQTYAENDVTGTLLVADPQSAMEAVNKRTLDGYLSKANIDDNFERVTTSKGLNPGTENYRIISTTSNTAEDGRIPVINSEKYIEVKGIKTVTPNYNVYSIGGDINESYHPTISIYSTLYNNTNSAQILLNKKETDTTRPNIWLINFQNIGGDKSEGTIIKMTSSNSITLSAGQFNTADKKQLSGMRITLNPSLQILVDTLSDGTASRKIEYECTANTLTFKGNRGKITGIKTPTNDEDAINKRYADTNFIKVEGTPQEGSTIAYIDGKWTVVDHTNWSPLT